VSSYKPRQAIYSQNKGDLLHELVTHSGADIDGLDTIAELFLVFVRDSVCHDDLLELAAVEGFNRISAQDAMCYDGMNVFGAFCYQDICSLHKRTTCVGHVVD
jgi:hypothetical protein